MNKFLLFISFYLIVRMLGTSRAAAKMSFFVTPDQLKAKSFSIIFWLVFHDFIFILRIFTVWLLVKVLQQFNSIVLMKMRRALKLSHSNFQMIYSMVRFLSLKGISSIRSRIRSRTYLYFWCEYACTNNSGTWIELFRKILHFGNEGEQYELVIEWFDF